jgi:shikimate dehydrogenase
MREIRRYGLIGKKLQHSFSPKYFTKKFYSESIADAEYKIYEMDDLSEVFVLFENGISGLNVTIPYKEMVIPLLDGLVGDAEAIRAVNTIKKVDNKLIGYNTDTYGFRESIKPYLDKSHAKMALILGTGGASKAVHYVLNELGIMCHYVSRSGGDISYSELDIQYIAEHTIIVNTTPLGMFPNLDDIPKIPYDGISPQHLMIDLIYNPEKTLFLKQGVLRGASVLNGLKMLEFQAEKSWQIWNS